MFSVVLRSPQGIGKEGILYKEGTSSKDWKARFFRLMDSKLVYYEKTSYGEVS